MPDYQTILLSIDLSEESIEVARRAQSIVSKYGAVMHIIHVYEPLNLVSRNAMPSGLAHIEDEIQNIIREELDIFSEQYGVKKEHRHLAIGKTETEVHTTAKEINADLIVVGSHNQHGLALLPGSTTDGVLHRADCDILAVHVQEADVL